MAAMTEEEHSSGLEQLDRLERLRLAGFERQRAALNRIGADPLADDPAKVEAAWADYCDAIRELEACVEELESLIWQLKL
jgi:hypothetical protein